MAKPWVAPPEAQQRTLSPSEFQAAISLRFPSLYSNPILVLVDGIGERAAIRAIANPRFVAAVNSGNRSVAGTLFHSAAAAEVNALPATALPAGWTVQAEQTVQAGLGGSRIDVLFHGPGNVRVEIDWKTTVISGLSTGSRQEMVRHAGQITSNLGGALAAQESRSWIELARAAWLKNPILGPWPL